MASNTKSWSNDLDDLRYPHFRKPPKLLLQHRLEQTANFLNNLCKEPQNGQIEQEKHMWDTLLKGSRGSMENLLAASL